MGAAHPPLPDAWAPTRTMTAMATQILGDSETYLGDGGTRALGRRIEGDRHELFVVCDPAEALAQQLTHLRPDYIALHAADAEQAMALLQTISNAAQRRLQTLVIRRQGYGTALATLDFIELAGAKGAARVRIYATIARGASAEQTPLIAATLVTHGKLVVVVGASTPLGPAHAQCVRLGAETDDAWPWMAQIWNERKLGLTIDAPPCPAAAPGVRTAPLAAEGMPLRPMPAVRGAQPVSAEGPWSDYLRRVGGLTGLVSACVFEAANQRTLGHVGRRPGPATLAVQGASLSATLTLCARTLGLPAGSPGLSATFAEHHLLMRPVPGHPGVLMMAVFDAQAATLDALCRRLDRLGPPTPQ